jgi:predicted transcriptional regulator
LSIKPRFAQAILDGRKKFEFRRTLFRDPGVERVVIYASSPTQRVIGEFSIAAVHSLPPEELWRRTREHAGIDRSYFKAYFAGRDVGHALEVGSCMRYVEPIELEAAFGFNRPPQSFCYVEDVAATASAHHA